MAGTSLGALSGRGRWRVGGSRGPARALRQAALLGFVKPQLGHLMAALQIDQGRVGKLAAVGYEAEIGQLAQKTVACVGSSARRRTACTRR